jgi:hypothetical protein
VKLKKTNFLPFLSKGKHRYIPPPLRILLYNCYYVIVDCAFTFQEFIETLECITTFVYHLDPIVVENSFVVLCLENRTLVEVEWQVPLTRLEIFYTLFHDWMI